MSSSRRFCFTSFLPEKPVLGPGVKYLCFGKEVCPKTKKEHWQGYVEVDHSMAGTAAMKRIQQPKAHYEASKGDLEDNKRYCSKDGKFEELGTPGKQGQRIDLEEIAETIKGGKAVRDVLWENPMAFHQYGRTMEALEKEAERRLPGRKEPMEVWVFYGPGGSGKSTAARKMFPNAFSKSSGSGKWWDGYAGEEEVIVGEMDFDLGINYWKQLMDEPIFNIEVKGGMKRFRAKRMIICSNDRPDRWWGWIGENHKNAFWRRIKGFKLFLVEPQEVASLPSVVHDVELVDHVLELQPKLVENPVGDGAGRSSAGDIGSNTIEQGC